MKLKMYQDASECLECSGSLDSVSRASNVQLQNRCRGTHWISAAWAPATSAKSRRAATILEFMTALCSPSSPLLERRALPAKSIHVQSKLRLLEAGYKMLMEDSWVMTDSMSVYSVRSLPANSRGESSSAFLGRLSGLLTCPPKDSNCWASYLASKDDQHQGVRKILHAKALGPLGFNDRSIPSYWQAYCVTQTLGTCEMNRQRRFKIYAAVSDLEDKRSWRAFDLITLMTMEVIERRISGMQTSTSLPNNSNTAKLEKHAIKVSSHLSMRVYSSAASHWSPWYMHTIVFWQFCKPESYAPSIANISS